MGVHDVASYVKFHQQKLKEQQAQTDAASTPTPNSAPQRKKKTGVDHIYSKNDFDAIVKKSGANEDEIPAVLLVDAFATWCGPCKQIAPVIAEMSNAQYSGKVGFYKFDVDNVPDLAQELGVRAMPTFFVYKNGEIYDQFVGANPKGLQALLDKALAE